MSDILQSVLGHYAEQPQKRRGMRPEVAAAFMGIGSGMSQLGAGQPVNMAPAAAAMLGRQPGARGGGNGMDAIMNDPVKRRAFMELAKRHPTLAEQLVLKSTLGFEMPQPEKPEYAYQDGAWFDKSNPQAGPVWQKPNDPDPYAAMQPPPGLPQQILDIWPQLPPESRQKVMDEYAGNQFDGSAFIVSGEDARQYGLPHENGEAYNVEVTPQGVKATRIGGSGTSVTVNNAPQSVGQEAFDKEAAKELVAFTQGGAADAVKNISQLKDVAESIRAGRAGNVSGPGVGIMPDAVNAFVNPSAVDVREQVEEVVQRNLKAILGAQFAQREGEQLIKRAWNPVLDEKVNLARLDRLIRQMELAYQAKAEAAAYFRENGTLTGWDGRLPSIDDFSVVLDENAGAGVRDDSSLFREYGIDP